MRGGCGSPFATSTDGTNNMIVWVVGTEDHQTGGTSGYTVMMEILEPLFMMAAGQTN